MVIELVNEKNKELFRNLFNMYLDNQSEYINSSNNVNNDSIDDYFKNDVNILPYIIKQKNENIGFIILTKSPYTYKDCDYCIQELFIIEDYRKKGIAKEVIKMLFSKYEGKYCLSIFEENINMIKFWYIICKRYGNNIKEINIDNNVKKIKVFVFNTINMNKTIETNRLILRPILIDDANDIFEWVLDKEVNKYMPYCLYNNINEVYDWINNLDKSNNEFSIYLKSDNKIIGSGSITEINNAYELGYNFNKNYWNKGYATEASKAMINWAFENQNARDFTSLHANDNYRSGNVIKKCGFKFSHYGKYQKLDGSQTFESTHYTMHLEKK